MKYVIHVEIMLQYSFFVIIWDLFLAMIPIKKKCEEAPVNL